MVTFMHQHSWAISTQKWLSIVKKHLGKLYEKMMEVNLNRIIEPYSKVQVKYVAQKIKLPESQVEKKISQMILDHKIEGILDQETGVLIVYDESPRDTVYDDVLSIVAAMSNVVDRLYSSAQKLS